MILERPRNPHRAVEEVSSPASIPAVRELIRLTGEFDGELKAVANQRLHRLELLPLLINQFQDVLPPDLVARFAGTGPTTRPDNSLYASSPLVWYFVQRLFLAAARGSQELGDAGSALDRAFDPESQFDTSVVESGCPLEILWTLPDLPINLYSIPVGITAKDERLRFLRSVLGGLDLIRDTCPTLGERICAELRWIIPMHEEDGGGHSMTLANLPGVIFVGATSGPDLMAELIVHEYLHTLLHAVAETRPLIDQEIGGLANYSPWREDARPAEGILHGIFVFTGVTLFWLDHLEPTSERAAYAADRVSTLAIQLEAAVESLLKAGTGEIVQRVVTLANGCIALVRRTALPEEQLANARLRAAHHFSQWSKHREH
jgi:hypothetical protein